MIKEKSITYHDIDGYIAAQSAAIRPTLEKLRRTIKDTVPAAQELISYRMPAFKYYGIVMYFAAFKKHYSIFIRPVYLQAFKNELKQYKTTKSAVNIPLEKAVPVRLVTKIARYAAHQNSKNVQLKLKKK